MAIPGLATAGIAGGGAAAAGGGLSLGSVLGGIGTGAGFLNAFWPQDEPEGLKEQRQAAADAITYTRAAVNPESPHFRAVETLHRAQRQRDLVAAIQEMVKMQNRARARGQVGPLTTNERRDETIASLIARGFTEAGTAARTDASQALMQAAGKSQGSAAAFSPVVQTNVGLDQAEFARRMQGFGALGDFGGALDQILRGRDAAPTSAGGKAYNQAFPSALAQQWGV